MNKNVEIEKGELILKNSYGDIAIVPKNDRNYIKEMIKKSEHHKIDEYVNNLPSYKDYAEDGTLISPPTIPPTGVETVDDETRRKKELEALESGELTTEQLALENKPSRIIPEDIETTKSETPKIENTNSKYETFEGMSFSDAFATARKKYGSEGKFYWIDNSGKKNLYGTKYASEVEKPEYKDEEEFVGDIKEIKDEIDNEYKEEDKIQNKGETVDFSNVVTKQESELTNFMSDFYNKYTTPVKKEEN